MQFVFNSISFAYVYKELNYEVYALSKEGLQRDVGVWTLLESKDR
jgi:hypothetical protein